MPSLPAEKGKNAGFFLKLPFWSKKCLGLKAQGVSHWSPFSTECNKGNITVPYLGEKNIILAIMFLKMFYLIDMHGIKDTLGIE